MSEIILTQFVDPTANVMFTGYQHAYKLYLSDNYKNVPKMAFMYFVKFNVNSQITNLVTSDWDPRFTALLTKSISLPKFKMATETINQYNRKTNVQTKITYDSVQLELHDDRGGGANGFWQNYYKYYYADSRYGDASSKIKVNTAYSDSKYGVNDYTYGLNTTPDLKGGGQPYFLDSIDIFLLHKNNISGSGDYTKITLINPLISSWEHDQLSQSEGNKIMANKMSIVYEDVIYETGTILNVDSGVSLFEDVAVYDKTRSPPPNSMIEPKEIIENDYVGKTYIKTIPNFEYYRQQQQHRSISLGEILTSINKVKLLIQQPRQAWNVYGVNIKNILVGSAIGKISATQINLTKPSANPQQGTVTKITEITNQGSQNA
jgi:hypothetical protein